MSSKPPYSFEDLQPLAARCLLLFCMIFIFYVIGVQHVTNIQTNQTYDMFAFMKK